MTKFISEIKTSEWEVETPFGWKSFSGIGKTIEFQEYVIITESGKKLICADDHILINHNLDEVFCKDLKKNDWIQTRNGLERISSVTVTDNYSCMYDLLDVEDGNIFYSNDIVSHNSTTVVSYLLHYTLFNDNVKVALLANKSETSREILSRYQLAYENLPKWLQQGVGIWNKGSVELENGSKAIAASTSSSAVRGNSFNCIVLDEFAHIPNHIAEEFFASVYPTISSGKTTKVIIISCVTKDTYLLTEKGYRKIDRLINHNKEGAYIVEPYNVKGKDKFYRSCFLVNNPKSPTNIIRTRYEEIECSENHKLWAFKDGEYGYFKSSELKVGDYISIKYNHQVYGNDDYIGFNPKTGKSSNTFSCEYVTKDIAYFVGLYVAEGYARDVISKTSGDIIGGQIVISCGDDISDSLDKLNVRYKKVDDVHYDINSKDLVDFLKTIGFDISKKATTKELPDKVLSWSKENLCSLLRGMFDGDGSASKNGKITYTSTSRELIRQVQLILANMGILGSVYKKIVKPTKKVKVESTTYNIEITGFNALRFYDTIGFALERKQERKSNLKISERLGNVIDVVPNSYQILKKLGCKLPYKNNSFVTFSRAYLLEHEDEFCQNKEIEQFFEDNVNENMVWLPIKEMKKGEAEVYDVSLPDIENDKWCHSVLYNNFLGHQTPMGMNLYYKLWHDAELGRNEYVPFEIHWSDVPGRDEKWKEQTIANSGLQNFKREFESLSGNTIVDINGNPISLENLYSIME